MLHLQAAHLLLQPIHLCAMRCSLIITLTNKCPDRFLSLTDLCLQIRRILLVLGCCLYQLLLIGMLLFQPCLRSCLLVQ